MKGRVKIGKERILSLLREGRNLTTREAAERTHLSERESRQILKTLHDVERVVHISGWFRTVERGPWMAEFKLGVSEDVKRPASMTTTERTERYRLKNNNDGYKVEGMPALRVVRSFIVKPDPIAATLFPWMYSQPSMAFNVRELEAA